MSVGIQAEGGRRWSPVKRGCFLGQAGPPCTLPPRVDLTFLAGALPHPSLFTTKQPQRIESKSCPAGSSSWTHMPEKGSSTNGWLLAFALYQPWALVSGVSTQLSSTSPGASPPGPRHSHSPVLSWRFPQGLLRGLHLAASAAFPGIPSSGPVSRPALASALLPCCHRHCSSTSLLDCPQHGLPS